MPKSKTATTRTQPQPAPQTPAASGAQPGPTHLPHLNLNAAAIDGGAAAHFVAVPEGRDTVAVRDFGAFTSDLQRLAVWLKECRIDTVVIESTGIYWIPLF